MLVLLTGSISVFDFFDLGFCFDFPFFVSGPEIFESSPNSPLFLQSPMCLSFCEEIN